MGVPVAIGYYSDTLPHASVSKEIERPEKNKSCNYGRLIQVLNDSRSYNAIVFRRSPEDFVVISHCISLTNCHLTHYPNSCLVPCSYSLVTYQPNPATYLGFHRSNLMLTGVLLPTVLQYLTRLRQAPELLGIGYCYQYDFKSAKCRHQGHGNLLS